MYQSGAFGYHCCSEKLTMHSVQVVELHVTVTCKKSVFHNNAVIANIHCGKKQIVCWYSCELADAVLKEEKLRLFMTLLMF